MKTKEIEVEWTNVMTCSNCMKPFEKTNLTEYLVNDSIDQTIQICQKCKKKLDSENIKLTLITNKIINDWAFIETIHEYEEEKKNLREEMINMIQKSTLEYCEECHRIKLAKLYLDELTNHVKAYCDTCILRVKKETPTFIEITPEIVKKLMR